MTESNFKQLLLSERMNGATELAGLFLAWKKEHKTKTETSFEDFYHGELSTIRLAQAIESNRYKNSLFAAYFDIAQRNQLRDQLIAVLATSTEREDPVALFYELNELRGSRFDSEFTIPTSIVSLMIALVSPGGTGSIYCPYFPDPMAFKGIQPEFRLFTDHPSATVAFWAEVTKRVFDIDLTNKKADCLESLTYTEGAIHIPRKFDAAILFPPFGARLRVPDNDSAGRFFFSGGSPISAETAIIQHARIHARHIAVCVPNGFLFKSTRTDQQLRAELIRNGAIKTVIALPQKVFKNTPIAVSIIAIDFTDSSDEILFVDARGLLKDTKKVEELSFENVLGAVAGTNNAYPTARIHVAEVIANNCVLSIERYMDRLDDPIERLAHETRKLSDIAEITRPQLLIDENDGKIEVAEVRFSDIPEAGFTTSGSKRLKTNVDNRIFEKYRLRPYDVLVASRGSIGETIPIGIIGPAPTELPLFPSQLLFTIRFRQDEDIKGRAISFYKYLRSEAGQGRLKKLLHGTTIPQLSAADMREFAVPIPTSAEVTVVQNAFDAESNLHEEITRLRGELSELKSVFIPSESAPTGNNG